MTTDYQIMADYEKAVKGKYENHNASEYTYRSPLEILLQDVLGDGYEVINEPSHVDCGKPDMMIRDKKKEMVFATVETKDIDKGDLDGKGKNQSQFDRYKHSLGHVVFTDYLDFHFFENSEKVEEIRIGRTKGGSIEFDEEQFIRLLAYIREYVPSGICRITSTKTLAKLMAIKARLMAQVIAEILDDETQSPEKDYLKDFCKQIKNSLMPNIDNENFAKVYSQTVAYGLFAARLNDATPDTFSRAEAAELIPRTNMFLRGIFNDMAGNNIHSRISWIVDDLVAMFGAADLQKIFAKQASQDRDPLIHFYEDFLAAFDPKDKKNFGVWYTPQQVVRFIVASVDRLLKERLGIANGLADGTKIENTMDATPQKELIPQVQILDPATGTGTFLAEVVNKVAEEYEGQPLAWQGYVHENLLQRLYGFEIQMASYTVAHIKLDMVLRKHGYKAQRGDAFHICLTDSLLSYENKRETSHWFSKEYEEGRRIKAHKPIMVLVGNPPYNGESKNKDKWIESLIEAYKREPGNEAKRIDDTKWLNNDYVKFIRLAQKFVEEKGEGIIGYINPNSYLDSLTFRGMRYELLKTFDEIYILNLHGSSKTRETCPDGSKDENVFDIQPGVCINFFVRRQSGKDKGERERGLGRVFYADLYGTRRTKLDYLNARDIFSPDNCFRELQVQAPMFLFMPVDFSCKEEFYGGFRPQDLFDRSVGVGMCSKRDKIAYQDTLDGIKRVVKDFDELDERSIKAKYNIEKESRDQKVSYAQRNVKSYGQANEFFRPVLYRPFDKKYTYFTDGSKGFIAYPVYSVMRHLIHKDKSKNLALIVGKTGQVVGDMPWNLAFVSDTIVDLNVFYRGGGYVCPLYLNMDETVTYKEAVSVSTLEKGIEPNLNAGIKRRIEQIIGRELQPEEALDYIYATLYSPAYREKYREFLKSDFPRIPYPAGADAFDALAACGRRLRELHLMRGAASWNANKLHPCRGEGTGMVEKRKWKEGRVYINDTQYYDNVSEEMWRFYIGGYQVADKWLKDRMGKPLDYEATLRYSQILYVIDQTIGIMQEMADNTND